MGQPGVWSGGVLRAASAVVGAAAEGVDVRGRHAEWVEVVVAADHARHRHPGQAEAAPGVGLGAGRHAGPARAAPSVGVRVRVLRRAGAAAQRLRLPGGREAVAEGGAGGGAAAVGEGRGGGAEARLAQPRPQEVVRGEAGHGGAHARGAAECGGVEASEHGQHHLGAQVAQLERAAGGVRVEAALPQLLEQRLGEAQLRQVHEGAQPAQLGAAPRRRLPVAAAARVLVRRELPREQLLRRAVAAEHGVHQQRAAHGHALELRHRRRARGLPCVRVGQRVEAGRTAPRGGQRRRGGRVGLGCGEREAVVEQHGVQHHHHRLVGRGCAAAVQHAVEQQPQRRRRLAHEDRRRRPGAGGRR